MYYFLLFLKREVENNFFINVVIHQDLNMIQEAG